MATLNTNADFNDTELLKNAEAANDPVNTIEDPSQLSEENHTIHSGEMPSELTEVAKAVKSAYLDTNNSIRDVINGQAQAIESVMGLALGLADQRKNTQKRVAETVLEGENPLALGLSTETLKKMQELESLLEGAANDDSYVSKLAA